MGGAAAMSSSEATVAVALLLMLVRHRRCMGQEQGGWRVLVCREIIAASCSALLLHADCWDWLLWRMHGRRRICLKREASQHRHGRATGACSRRHAVVWTWNTSAQHEPSP